jgi:hypothetical protein
MKISHWIILALSAFGVYLTWKSIQATQQNTLAILGNDNMSFDHIIAPHSQTVQNSGAYSDLSNVVDNIAPTLTPNLTGPISPSLLNAGS